MSTVKYLVVDEDLEFKFWECHGIWAVRMDGLIDWLIDWLNVKSIYQYLLIDIGQIGHELI